MSAPRRKSSKRPREKYSRLICIGCRDRRIRCEGLEDVAIPSPGEWTRASTPCYRCQRIGKPCVIRQTILGRPGPARTSTSIGACDVPAESGGRPPHVDVELFATHALRLHVPQSSESALRIFAIDTLRYEYVEDEWFRHLPAHVGHTPALDLSVKALVLSCAVARGISRLTPNDCYKAFAHALAAVRATIVRCSVANDDLLASTALLAPFEGVIKKNGVPTRLHVDGLAAILTARPSSYPVTPLARDILDFNACETGVMACIQGTTSPFETIPRAYYAYEGTGCSNNDRAKLKALANEIFIRMPRLVILIRSISLQPCPSTELQLKAMRLLDSLVELKDSGAEEQLLHDVEIRLENQSDDPSTLRQTLQFAAVKDFEALTSYWQGRLSLLRLRHRLCSLYLGSTLENSLQEEREAMSADIKRDHCEIHQTASRLLSCMDYAECGALPLFRQMRLWAHAIVVVYPHAEDTMSTRLLRSVNLALRAKPELTAHDMSVASDLFAAGPIEGRFAELFGT